MGTVSKALGLLGILAQPDARHGLTEIARLSGYDKATTRRLLVELKDQGFVEQDEQTRAYLLGPTLLMLGRAREDRFPFLKIALPVVRSLAEASGETAHASEYAAGAMASVCSQESDKSNRVIVPDGERLPLHATASGLAYLSASAAGFVDAILGKALPGYATNTLTDPDALRRLIATARGQGYALCNQLRADGVCSVASPILGPRGTPVGAIAVAMPSVRADAAKLAAAGALAAQAAADISIRLFGKAATAHRARKP